jgi:hypothetical protein
MLAHYTMALPRCTGWRWLRRDVVAASGLQDSTRPLRSPDNRCPDLQQSTTGDVQSPAASQSPDFLFAPSLLYRLPCERVDFGRNLYSSCSRPIIGVAQGCLTFGHIDCRVYPTDFRWFEVFSWSLVLITCKLQLLLSRTDFFGKWRLWLF